MLSHSLFALLALPLLVLAQSRSSAAPNASQNVITVTTVSTFVSLGPDRQVTTGTRTLVFTTTQPVVAAPTTAPSNSTQSSNSTVSGAVPSGNATSSRPASTAPLATAPTNVNGGGGSAGAPLPGATGGAFGPDDGYIAAATSLKRNAFVVGMSGFVVGGALMML